MTIDHQTRNSKETPKNGWAWGISQYVVQTNPHITRPLMPAALMWGLGQGLTSCPVEAGPFNCSSSQLPQVIRSAAAAARVQSFQAS